MFVYGGYNNGTICITGSVFSNVKNVIYNTSRKVSDVEIRSTTITGATDAVYMKGNTSTSGQVRNHTVLISNSNISGSSNNDVNIADDGIDMGTITIASYDSTLSGSMNLADNNCVPEVTIAVPTIVDIDQVTSTTPTLGGTADSGATVTFKLTGDNTDFSASAVADGSGEWSYTVGQNADGNILGADGTYTVSIVSLSHADGFVIRADNDFSSSITDSFILDTTTPDQPTVTLPATTTQNDESTVVVETPTQQNPSLTEQTIETADIQDVILRPIGSDESMNIDNGGIEFGVEGQAVSITMERITTQAYRSFTAPITRDIGSFSVEQTLSSSLSQWFVDSSDDDSVSLFKSLTDQFKSLDADQSGTLNSNEFQDVFEDEELKDGDLNGDGVVDQDEFLKMFNERQIKGDLTGVEMLLQDSEYLLDQAPQVSGTFQSSFKKSLDSLLGFTG